MYVYMVVQQLDQDVGYLYIEQFSLYESILIFLLKEYHAYKFEIEYLRQRAILLNYYDVMWCNITFTVFSNIVGSHKSVTRISYACGDPL